VQSRRTCRTASSALAPATAPAGTAQTATSGLPAIDEARVIRAVGTDVTTGGAGDDSGNALNNLTHSAIGSNRRKSIVGRQFGGVDAGQGAATRPKGVAVNCRQPRDAASCNTRRLAGPRPSRTGC
jgi:hypothetical protein